MAGSDVFKALHDLPFRRFALVQINRANDNVDRLGVPADYDQYPGKTDPAAHSCWYGPIGLQATRHVGEEGFDAFAPLVTPAVAVLPRDNNILTGHDYAFYWTSTNVVGFIQLGYTESVGGSPFDPRPLGDIFDPALEGNGGAQVWMNFSQQFPLRPRICFDIDLYDKKRGRSITDKRINSEIFLGGNFEAKRSFGPMRWDPDTEIEPRVHITEVRMGDMLDTDEAFDASQVAIYLNILFKGYHGFSEHPTAGGAP